MNASRRSIGTAAGDSASRSLLIKKQAFGRHWRSAGAILDRHALTGPHLIEFAPFSNFCAAAFLA